MHAIATVQAREVLDSRGNPTVEAQVTTSNGSRGRAIAPSGASTGRHEAIELRDGDRNRFAGKGVRQAVGHVRGEIAAQLHGLDVADQFAIDRAMIALDGTPDKSRLGANALLAVSLASAHAAAASEGVPLFRYLNRLLARLEPESGQPRSPSLPLPMVNMISGGRHAGGQLDFQDFLAVPLGARTYSDALAWISAIYRALGTVLAEGNYEHALVGDEGGYGPRLGSNREALDLLMEAFTRAGLEPASQVAIAIDVASTQFYRDGRYHFRADAVERSADQLAEEIGRWVDRYPIVSIEDGCAEDDWTGWRQLTERLGSRVQLIGDDLFTTNPARLRRGIDERVANAILIKPNQIGTLTETLEVMRAAWNAGYRTIVSARSGETEDATIAHLAVGTAAGQIKIGSIVRSERLAKYNELLRVEEELSSSAVFARSAIAPVKSP